MAALILFILAGTAFITQGVANDDSDHHLRCYACVSNGSKNPDCEPKLNVTSPSVTVLNCWFHDFDLSCVQFLTVWPNGEKNYVRDCGVRIIEGQSYCDHLKQMSPYVSECKSCNTNYCNDN